ncbi:hypothetical protein [Hyphobacterium sp.]|uniref:hypothetical protein n=1 Tax=Hyphobacterium sp. TaxID=2004662 RepID=UPI003B51AA8B
MTGLVNIDRKIHILHVEDDDGDAFLTARAFRSMDTGIELHRVTGGQDALQFLSQSGPYAGAPSVQCVLLDLMMANGDGLWLLDRLSEMDQINVPPTIVVSGDPDGVADSRKFPFVSCSIVKPDTNAAFEVLLETVRRITMMSVGKVA